VLRQPRRAPRRRRLAGRARRLRRPSRGRFQCSAKRRRPRPYPRGGRRERKAKATISPAGITARRTAMRKAPTKKPKQWLRCRRRRTATAKPSAGRPSTRAVRRRASTALRPPHAAPMRAICTAVPPPRTARRRRGRRAMPTHLRRSRRPRRSPPRRRPLIEIRAAGTVEATATARSPQRPRWTSRSRAFPSPPPCRHPGRRPPQVSPRPGISTGRTCPRPHPEPRPRRGSGDVSAPRPSAIVPAWESSTDETQ